MTRVTIDDTAAATTTSFIVAVAVFVLAFSVVTVFVKTQGGDTLTVTFEKSTPFQDVKLEGPARLVYTGHLPKTA